jgi:hypothetical protein
MFIELVEYLRCPQDHLETHCVLSTAAMSGRYVVSGVAGCPACQREYSIERGIVKFGAPPSPPSGLTLPDVDAVHALLNVASPGGNVVLVGTAGHLAAELGKRLEGVHLVGINAPPGTQDGSGLSLLENDSSIPLRSAMARGLVVGPEYVSWGADAVRVLLPGLRLVVLKEEFDVHGVERMAVGQGMWVGRKISEVVRIEKRREEGRGKREEDKP